MTRGESVTDRMTAIEAPPIELFINAIPPPRVARAEATVEPTTGIMPDAAYLAARRVALSFADATTL